MLPQEFANGDEHSVPAAVLDTSLHPPRGRGEIATGPDPDEQAACEAERQPELEL
jgi:hypothetical protein